MGGQDSEIKDSTRAVLLECAYFTPRGVRRTARRHGMHTESSHRFERGVDWANVAHVLEHAKSLLSELAGGKVVSGAIHEKGKLPTLRASRSVRSASTRCSAWPCRSARPRRSSAGSASRSSRRAAASAEARLVARGASFRPDVSREEDLIEEVGRVRGLDLIPTGLAGDSPAGAACRRANSSAKSRTKPCRWVSSEALTYAFVNPRDLERLGAPAPVVKPSRTRSPKSAA